MRGDKQLYVERGYIGRSGLFIKSARSSGRLVHAIYAPLTCRAIGPGFSRLDA
jgi:hypothetical protein